MTSPLELKLMLEEQPEFKYSWGDFRPILMEYLLTFPNVTSYTTPQQVQRSRTACFVNPCKGETALKRVVLPPRTTLLQQLVEEMTAGTSPFIIIPFMLISKKQCAAKPLDRNKHLMYVLYNRHTHELERIDIKKYHIKDFRIKIAFKKLTTDFLATLQEHDPSCFFVGEHDLDNRFLVKWGPDFTEKDMFPFYLMAYLRLRLAHPKKTSKHIISLVLKTSPKKILGYWKDYVDFRSTVPPTRTCDDEKGSVLNLENNRCMSGKTSKRFLTQPEPKQCKDKQVYNIVTRRCTTKSRNIDIFTENVNNMKVARNASLQSLGNFKIGLTALMWVVGQYPHAFLVVPSSTDGSKGKSAVTWAPDRTTRKHALDIPDGFWETWTEGMMSPARFLIVPVSLTSIENGRHANCLIYDKHTNEMERFDGLGPDTSSQYRVNKLDTVIENEFKIREGTHVPSGLMYFTPLDYCPRKTAIFQSKELDEVGFDDLRGNCAIWRLWYIHVRMANPHLKRNQIVKYAMNLLNSQGSFQRFTKSYHAYILANIV